MQSCSACSEGESDDTDGNGSKGCIEAGGGVARSFGGVARSFGSDADLHLLAGSFLEFRVTGVRGLVVGTDNTRKELALLQLRGFGQLI